MADHRKFSRLAVTPEPNGRDWRLLEPLSFGDLAVPEGFVTDFASIPRALWAIYPPNGKWAPAAVLHDFLYRTGTRTRAEADALFLAGMAVLRVPVARRFVMYLAVRCFGWSSWRGTRGTR